MEQYIKKSDVVAEIERKLESISNASTNFALGRKMELANILSFLDTLETKEEILDKEGKTKLMKKCVHKAYKRGYNMGVRLTINKMIHNTKNVDLEKEYERYYEQERNIQTFKLAKHFFELGLKAQRKISYVPNIDDSLKELGVDPSSKEAKIFKESYYMALEKFKAQKGE